MWSKVIFGLVCMVYILSSAWLSHKAENAGIFVGSMFMGLFLLPIIGMFLL